MRLRQSHLGPSFHSEFEEGQAGKPSERNKSDSRELGLEKILDRREDGNCDNLVADRAKKALKYHVLLVELDLGPPRGGGGQAE